LLTSLGRGGRKGKREERNGREEKKARRERKGKEKRGGRGEKERAMDECFAELFRGPGNDGCLVV